MLSKAHLIDSIREINSSARTEFLRHFEPSALRLYLDHLQLAVEPRDRESTWVRRHETGPVVTRKPLLL